MSLNPVRFSALLVAQVQGGKHSACFSYFCIWSLIDYDNDSLIALMLGRLGMSTAQALASFRTIGQEIFKNKKIVGDGNYKASVFEKEMKRIVRDSQLGAIENELLCLPGGPIRQSGKT